MVDFNNESTVSTPPGEVVKIVVLEARQQVTQAMEFYERNKFLDIESEQKLAEVFGNVRHLWRQIKAMAYRRLSKGGEMSYQEVEDAIMGARTFEELDEAYTWMNRFIDDMGLTVIDTRARYDRTNVEDANEKKGM